MARWRSGQAGGAGVADRAAPPVIDELDRELADPEALSGAGRFVMRPLGSSTGAVPKIELTVRERELMALIGEQPKPVRRVAVSSGAQRSLAALARKGLVQIAGLTPSDARMCSGCRTTGRARRR